MARALHSSTMSRMILAQTEKSAALQTNEICQILALQLHQLLRQAQSKPLLPSHMGLDSCLLQDRISLQTWSSRTLLWILLLYTSSQMPRKQSCQRRLRLLVRRLPGRVKTARGMTGGKVESMVGEAGSMIDVWMEETSGATLIAEVHQSTNPTSQDSTDLQARDFLRFPPRPTLSNPSRRLTLHTLFRQLLLFRNTVKCKTLPRILVKQNGRQATAVTYIVNQSQVSLQHLRERLVTISHRQQAQVSAVYDAM